MNIFKSLSGKSFIVENEDYKFVLYDDYHIWVRDFTTMKSLIKYLETV